MNREQAVACAKLAIRASWRIEIHPEEIETAGRILAGLARGDRPSSAMRLAAAGRELLSIRELAVRMQKLVREGELPLGSADEKRILDGLPLKLEEPVQRIEDVLGTFPEPDSTSRKSGVRETFLLELGAEQQKSACSIVDLAHQSSDAPEPAESVGTMMLRAIAEDLREVERFLTEASEEIEEEQLREVVRATSTDCAVSARSIEAGLPPAPDLKNATEETRT